jgi:PAS domain S-box-containing protein
MMTEISSVLIVDDTPANRQLVVEALGRRGYRVLVAQDGEEGIERARLVQPDLILLDVRMPGIDGFETCRRLKADPEVQEIPVIFMTALSEQADKVNGFAAGGVDYVTKPFQIDELLARVATHVKLRRLQKQLEAQNAELRRYRDNLEQQVAARTEEVRLMSHALNRVQEAAYLLDENGRIIYVNDEACRALGYGVDDLLNMTLLDIDPNLTSEIFAEYWNNTRRLGSVMIEAVNRRRDGSEFPIEVNASYFEYGDKAYCLALARDITERKEADRRLMASEREFRTLAENSPNIIMRYDADCHCLYVNPACAKESEASRGQDIGSQPAPPWGGEAALTAEYEAQLRAVIKSGDPVGMQINWARQTGETVYHALQIVPECDLQGQVIGVLVIGHDITALKLAEQRLQDSYDLLQDITSRRETAREDERKRIAREIHDELGQNLTALRMGISSLRLEFGNRNAALAERVQELMQLADRTLRGVREVATALRPNALDAGLTAGLEWLASEFERHSGLPCRLTLPSQPLGLDDGRAMALFRIVQESLTNVARHAEARSASVTLSENGGQWLVEVSDDGRGFDPASAGRKSLGLVGMRERALMLGGDIGITSAPGRGTTITVRMPGQDISGGETP